MLFFSCMERGRGGGDDATHAKPWKFMHLTVTFLEHIVDASYHPETRFSKSQLLLDLKEKVIMMDL